MVATGRSGWPSPSDDRSGGLPGVRWGLEARELIGLGVARGESLAEIARRLARPTSTVAREAARNGGRHAYRATRAQGETRMRAARPRARRLVASVALAAVVAEGLARLWSPGGRSRRDWPLTIPTTRRCGRLTRRSTRRCASRGAAPPRSLPQHRHDTGRAPRLRRALGPRGAPPAPRAASPGSFPPCGQTHAAQRATGGGRSDHPPGASRSSQKCVPAPTRGVRPGPAAPRSPRATARFKPAPQRAGPEAL